MSDHDPYDLEAAQERDATVKTAAEQEARWEIEDLVWLVRSKRGRRVLWRILENAGVYRMSHVPGDALSTAFNEGQRNIGMRLMALVMANASSDYGLMVQERSNG